MYETNLTCLNCGKEYPLGRMFEGCPQCREENFAANLVVDYDYELIKERIDRNVLEKRKGHGIWKYEELLPMRSEGKKITLGEGETPLLECDKLGAELGIKLYVKDESRNPTHSHKDRLISVGASVATKFRSKYLIAGGGNAAAATSAYGARYNLETISFERTHESKQAILQTLSYGGKIVYLKRPYEDRNGLMKKCVDVLKAYPVSSYTPSPTGNPYNQEGYKTIAYEICEQLNWDVPDKVIVPAEMGFSLYGVWRGFVDFYEMGLIDSLPNMIGAESAAGGSLTQTFLSGSEKIKKVIPKKTIARHAVGPKVSYKGYRAIKDSNGRAVTVEDDEIMNVLLALARKEGIYSSTTSATTLAAAKKLRNDGYINEDSTVVCVMTAGGLKDPDHIEKNFPELPEPIEGDWEKFKALTKNRYNLSF